MLNFFEIRKTNNNNNNNNVHIKFLYYVKVFYISIQEIRCH